MGFFGNLWDGIKSAGQWALDHSADVTPVVDAVTKVAHTMTTNDEQVPRHINAAIQASVTAEDVVDLQNYHKLFGYVNQQLINTAERNAKAERSAFLQANAKGSVTERQPSPIYDNVSGVWTMPIGLDSKGHPSSSMYDDLSTFLATTGIPPTITMGGEAYDTADHMGSALFVASGPLSNSTEPDAIHHTPVHSCIYSASLDNGGSIHACHAYYRLPLGKGASDYALHSAISVNYITTDASQASYLSDCKEASFHQPLTIGANQWMITLNITWGSAPSARDAQKSFVSNFTQENTGMSIHHSHVSGVLQLLKVSAPATSTPAAVRMAVQTAAVATLAALAGFSEPSDTSANKSPGGGSGFSPINVNVEVTDSSFLSATSS